MQKEQTLKKCSICQELIPQINFSIHLLYCSFKSQSSSNKQSTGKIKKKNSKLIKQDKNPDQFDFEIVTCSFCGQVITFFELDVHPSICAAGNMESCKYCLDPYPATLMQDHQNVCEANQHRFDHFNHQIEKPQERRLNQLTELMEILRLLLNDSQLQNQGLSKEKLQTLQKFQYKPGQQKDICTICYCKLEEKEQCLQLKCKHFYHAECISKWLEISCVCPVCKCDQKQSK